MPSVSPTDPGLLEGSPPPSVSPAGCVELEGSLAGLGDMPLTSQCSVESLGSLDSGHSSSAGNGAAESHAGSPSPGPIISTPPPPAATSPTPSAFSTPTSPRTHPEDRCDSSGRISVASMGSSQDRPPSGINRSLSNTSTASVASTDTVDTLNSTDTINSAATSATNNTSTSTSTSTSSTTIVTPIKSKEELDSYIDHLDSLWSQEDEWIMIFDNLIRNTEASTRSRRHTHHYSHYHNNGTTSNHSSPYHSPYKKGKGDDEVDRASRSLPRRPLALRKKVKSGGSKSRASSAPPVRRSVLGAALPPKSAGAGESGGGGGPRTTIKRVPSISRGRAGSSSSSTAPAGAVDEASFFASFEDVPKVNIYSARELEDSLTKIREVISSPSNDWDKRVDALKKLRSLLIAGANGYEEFYPHLRLLEPAMQLSIKDLRSQVVREACITVAYMSQELHHKVDHLCETVLPNLIYLIPNSAKVMASSGVVTIRFIIQNTHHHKLIPILLREISSKNREIRKVLCEVLDQLVHTWPTHSMEKHVLILAETIKKGITDADPEARAFSRKAYWGFAGHFKDEADKLLNSLDPSYKKMLQGEMSMSNSSSSQSLHNSQKSAGARPGWSRSSSTAGSTENLSGMSSRLPQSGMRRSAIPTPASHRPQDSSDSPAPSHTPTNFRSNSAIDLQAARRAQARSQYAQAQRLKVGSGASLRTEGEDKARPRKTSDHPPISSITSPDRMGRPRSRGGVSQSQPGSRSGSPSSRLSYATYSSPGDSGTLGRSRRRSGIPRSTGTSREPSPSRYSGLSGISPSKSRSRSISGASEMPPQVPGKSRQVMAQKILQQSREAESALADALVSLPPGGGVLRSPNRKMYSKAFEDQSDNDSETSSICSERSFDSCRRSDQFWYGSQQRILKEVWEPTVKMQDVSDIILNCASTHWGDRKEGLMALQAFLRGSHMLTGSELKRVTEIFTKMFMDAHTKVFTLFLDTLMELIMVHKADLGDWLYILLTRLLNKLGSDLLGSVQTKIHKTLDLVRDSFPCDQQFIVLMRFLVDQAQTPNSKVKVATLTYLKCLVDVMDRGDLTASPDTPMALAKILTWTADQKSLDIRRAASACFIAMFNCNITEFTALLQQLPSACQSTASQIIQSHLKRAASLDASPSSLPTRTPPSAGGTPVLQSPNTSLPRSHRSSRHNTIDFDDTENLNPEEVYRSLKRTTAEIQNYSFDLDLSSRRDSLEKHRDSTSQDSGISQLSAGGGDLRTIDTVDDKGVEDTNGILSGRSSSVSSPTHRNLSMMSDSSRNGLDTLTDDDLGRGDGQESDAEIMSGVVAELGNTEEGRTAEKRAALTSLIRLARTGSTLVWNENFRAVLRLLLESLACDDGGQRALVLAVLTEMMRRSPLVHHFLSFSELIILRVLNAHADKEKEVLRAASVCAGTVAEILPPEVVIRVLKPLIQMGEYPVNQAAIKMLNKLVEAHQPSIVAAALPEIMPGLIKAYDNKESCVRKASVFCMVALHNAVGEDAMRPHLESLTGSKLKLLNLYIKRAETQNSGASSPKSEPPP
ncbi:CLIP-associating protein 2-like isoform X1 [Penaeus monodon]|uniref:CLIP-associating protein 2-like isoform X1 n=1 Tax=Penaeus monodon TaxID=6687 RepID=UPI0018A7D2E2|nr:CLIP-associating protein 2-like isoform X1 [Penaeus monodon]